MKLCVQHTRRSPRRYELVDSADWPDVPKKPAPEGPRPPDDGHLDDDPGHVFSVCVQGVDLGGKDSYAFEDLNDGSGGVRATVWNDDPVDWPEGDKYAEVWTFLPLAPDPRIGGAINTRQSRVFYAQPNKMALLTRNPPAENTEYRPWSEFVPPDPAITRHGVWTTDAHAKRHEEAHGFVEWRDWTEGLPLTELNERGQVKPQRPQGRYDKPRGTITYFLHDVILTNPIHVVERELEMEETDVGASVSSLATVPLTDDRFTHVFTTPSGSPNDADWPSGAYRCQLDVQTAMLIDGYGFLTRGGSAGHFARVDSGLTADQETWTQTEPAFTGTGIKLATRTLDPASGAAGDRYECIVAADNSDTMMNGTLTIRVDDSDSFADGPWGVTDHALVIASLDQLVLLDLVTMTQVHQLPPAELAQLVALDVATLLVDHTLAIAELLHLVVLDAATITQVHTLPAAELAQLVVLDAAAITQVHTLPVAALDQLVVLDVAILTASQLLIPAGLDQLVVLDATALTQVHALSAAALDHLVLLDAATVTQVHQLPASDLDQLVVLDAAAIVLNFTLVAADLFHLVVLDGVTITQVHVLPAAELTQLVVLDAAVMTGVHALLPADLTQVVVLDAATMTGVHQLVAAELAQLVLLDDAALLVDHTLSPAELTQLVLLDVVALATGATILVVADLTHLVILDAASFKGISLIAPGKRQVTVAIDRRSVIVAADVRRLEVASEARTLIVPLVPSVKS